jgi:serine/threonine protein kinase
MPLVSHPAPNFAIPAVVHRFAESLDGNAIELCGKLRWNGERATPANDVFSFGLLFFELISGRRALSDKTLSEILARLRSPHLPTSLANELPEAYRELVIGMLALDPGSRPTAESLHIALRERKLG